MAKILVVDDERVLVKGITFNLKNEGYQVETGYDGEEAVELAREGNFDLIILDLMMPKIDGLQACMRIREFSNVPVIMLTAKGEDADKIMGFECGADDYITKPFNILELKARIKALLRRAGGPSRAGRSPALLTVGDLSLDTEQRVALRDGRTIDLTAKEYDLLELLMKQAHITPQDRKVVSAALNRAEQTGAPAAAMELPDGKIITGKTSDLLGSSAALLLNALKELAGISHETHILSPA